MSYTAKMQFVPEITRSEAVSKCHGIAYPEAFVQALEALGLIKFKEQEEKPAFEIRTRMGFEIKIWADGRIEGIEGSIVNRIPELIAKANQK